MNIRRLFFLFLLVAFAGGIFMHSNVAVAQTAGEVPGQSLGVSSDADLWRYIRQGNDGNTQIKNELAKIMIQSEGDNWRAIRNGPVSYYGAAGIFGIIFLLVAFYSWRGKILIEKGASGKTIERFAALDRFAHWLMAISFVLLALTGLNLLYGRYFLAPLIGKEAFASITMAGKYVHNYIAFAFMTGLGLAFVRWVRDNVPSKVDLQWIKQGGGMFSKGAHPPARKFNAGQKIIFWAVMIGGLSVSMSGIALLFPYETHMFSKTFGILNTIGFDLPTNLTPLEEQQYNQVWHAIVSLVLIVMIIAHIYIGSVGMEGAFDAMYSGQVDKNWAKEHHGLWVEEMDEKDKDKASIKATNKVGGRSKAKPAE